MKKRSLLLNQENPKASLYFKLKIAAAFLIICAFSALAWYSYEIQISNIKESELPLIKAPTGNFKTKPDKPGGLKINHQDKEIYEHISGNKNKVKAKLVDKNYKSATHDKIKKSIKKQNSKNTKKLSKAKQNDIKPVIINLPKVKKSPKKVIKRKDYFLRIASLKSANVKRKAWNIMKKKYPGLSKYSYKITRIKRNGKNIYFLDAGPFPSNSKAKAQCDLIKKAGGKCKLYKKEA